jgi:hypothetical protein
MAERSADHAVVVAAPPRAAPLLALGPLPSDLTLLVLCRLPLRERVRAEAVCRGWRLALRAPDLWRRLNLSPLGTAATDVLLDALVARTATAGGLRRLNLSGCERVSVGAMLRAAHAGGAGGGGGGGGASAGGGGEGGLRITAPSVWWNSDQVRKRAHARCHARWPCCGAVARARGRWQQLPAARRAPPHACAVRPSSATHDATTTTKPNPCSPPQLFEALEAHPALSLRHVECYAEGVEPRMLRVLRSARGGVRVLLLSRWGAAAPGALGGAPPPRALAAALARRNTLRRLELDDGTFTTAGTSHSQGCCRDSPFVPSRSHGASSLGPSCFRQRLRNWCTSCAPRAPSRRRTRKTAPLLPPKATTLTTTRRLTTHTHTSLSA